MLKRKLKKVPKALEKLLKSGRNLKKFLLCKECDDIEVEVGVDIGAVTCAYCVQRQVAPPDSMKPKVPGEKFPRGWALRATYIHTDGRIFEKGVDTGRKYEPTKAEPKKKKKIPAKKKVAPTKKKVVKKTTKRRK